MELTSLATALKSTATWGVLDVDIRGVQYDSRKVGEGDCFVALRGEHVDGHRFIETAIDAGAAAIVAEDAPSGNSVRVPWIRVKNTRKALGIIANELYDRPSEKLIVVGVTGTNGKTTTALIAQHLFDAAQRQCGLLGTIRYDNGRTSITADRTTPESSDVHRLLAEMVENDCRAAVMEVSSHGLDQHRVEGVSFDIGVFTNLTQDHLDYHGSIPKYFAAKKKLFQQLLGPKPVMIVNGDDTWGQKLLRDPDPGVTAISFGQGVHCDFRASNIRVTFSGTTFTLHAKGRELLVRLPFIGDFNVYNALAALAATNAAGLNLREAVTNLAEAPQVPGRMECVSGDRQYHVFVDYAHTPDAIDKAASTLRKLEPRRLITVFGCGGDRDHEKRALMAKAASEHSDAVILTSDNPRTEDPRQILEQAAKGIVGATHTIVEDRAEAINLAIESVRPRDVILIAGKGHETYQQFADKTIDFDDRKVARNAIARIRDVRIQEKETRERERENER
ncbi:MAG: UDP-N-acetylmuramoyl-L-alanyl-D-glutamate--2,6-diaminopimelate ligase [Verrucomicrobiales bacterium]|jgi:UDP-N-acetylmuramoyl-L-alanyl-D-glutamate--2,6-diaminopimelate ligase